MSNVNTLFSWFKSKDSWLKTTPTYSRHGFPFFLLQVVGCNKKLRSTKVFDRCLKCGGNGGSCFLTHGTYTKNYRVYGKEQYMINLSPALILFPFLSREDTSSFLEAILRLLKPTFQQRGWIVFTRNSRYFSSIKFMVPGSLLLLSYCTIQLSWLGWELFWVSLFVTVGRKEKVDCENLSVSVSL